ncbi:MAG TPA: 16S rRNA (cytosine(1402)-N(4))-methyltransferase RsmH [Enteractinococcus helveticum]|uniref:Ribosomal RNA small subunit methyltransferase H n=1 Tax=Enteractinococcus helveticum TaxID=1837282 RepID=A0A921K7M5_9MICC|nr:16S rRNA (cytosine(1402)-N(4))-methyltransferase RsmH [Enteractinococcus helveticum]HJF14870.1 16S rRNA (cytosine(1402)-N(4))-methyltransferase RsmH [Enteractinococcus helveticum]
MAVFDQNDRPAPKAAKRHIPVMADRVIDLLAPGIESARENQRQPVVVDATLGMGGHTEIILNRFDDAVVVGIDRDTQALALAIERLAAFENRFVAFHGTYDQIPEALAAAGVAAADGYLFDLGVSSYQLDERDRGFAYSYDAPLDMRMDPTARFSAADVVNDYDQKHLEQIIRRYGEEKFARRIATAVVERRQTRPFTETGDLVEVIRSAVPVAAGRSGGHPAKRTFQALRIEVNEELDILREALPAAMSGLHVGGRMVVMSYHSLEDRITKKAFQKEATSLTPPGFPVELEEYAPVVDILTRGTEKPTKEEIDQNPRAASAKVRAIQKIRPTRSNG